jgi:undecaprenyl-diphosphatase
MLQAVPPDRRASVKLFSAIALACAAVFGLSALLVGFGLTDGFDEAVQRPVASAGHRVLAHGHWLAPASAAVARLGSAPFAVAVGGTAAVAFLVFRRSLVPGMLLGLSLLFVAACVGGLKDLYNRAEPYARANHLGFSFPSGHAACALAVWGGAAALILIFAPRGVPSRLETVLAVVCGVVAFSVGAAMLARSAHWLSDVIAGVVLGAGWFAVWGAVFEAIGWLPPLPVRWTERAPVKISTETVAFRSET